MALSLRQSRLNTCLFAQLIVCLLRYFNLHVHFFALLPIQIFLRLHQSQVVSHIVVLVVFELQLNHLAVCLLLMVLRLAHDGQSVFVLLSDHFLVLLTDLGRFLLHNFQVQAQICEVGWIGFKLNQSFAQLFPLLHKCQLVLLGLIQLHVQHPGKVFGRLCHDVYVPSSTLIGRCGLGLLA